MLLRNFPITTSDHAPIFLQTTPPTPQSFRPYQIESWCLGHPEVKSIVLAALLLQIEGSPMYALSRKLALIRSKLKIWCLDKRLFWGINWHRITNQLATTSLTLSTITQGSTFMGQRDQLLTSAALAYSYWK